MNKTRLIVHPGWAKTGTTAIQNYFSENYAAYAEAGLLYPNAGRKIDNAHHELALALEPREGLPEVGSPVEVLASIHGEFEESGCQQLLISSELLPVAFQYAAFAEFAQGFDIVDVIFTLRRQSDLIVSMYKQLLKDPSIIFEEDFNGIYRKHADWMDFETQIARWKSLEVVSSIRVVCHSANVVGDFVGTLGLPLFKNGDNRSNESPSDLAAMILAATTSFRASLSVDERTAFVAYVQERLAPVASEFRLLDPKVQELIDATYAPGNARLVRAFPDASPLLEPVNSRDASQSVPSDETIQFAGSLFRHWFKA